MGREIRRVPADWKHPERECPHWPKCTYKHNTPGMHFKPLNDQAFDDAAAEWKAGFKKWEKEKHEGEEFWEYEGNPPAREDYRDRAWTEEEATHYQLYETVSEGSPVSPAFATKDELVAYLVEHGDYWGDRPWSKAAARRMVDSGYAPSLIITRTPDEFKIQSPEDVAERDV